MRKEDLSKAIGDIDPKLVESSLAYRPAMSRHRLTRIVALAACLAVIVTAIPLALILNRESTNSDLPVVTTPAELGNKVHNIDKKPINVIYCDADMLASQKEIQENVLKEKTVDFKVFERYTEDIDYEYQYLEYSEDVPKSLSVFAGTEEIKCTLDYVYYTDDILSENETIRSRAKIARYKVDKECFPDYFRESDAWVLYRVNTKEIIELSIPSSASLHYGPVTLSEARSLADRDIKTLFGEDVLSKYKCELEYISGTYVLSFIYRRSVGFFSTKEEIALYYDGHGKLLTVLSDYVGLYDGFESVLTEKNLLKAEEEAMYIIDGKLVENKFIIMSKDGEPCIFYNCKNLIDGEIKYYNIGFKIQ